MSSGVFLWNYVVESPTTSCDLCEICHTLIRPAASRSSVDSETNGRWLMCSEGPEHPKVGKCYWLFPTCAEITVLEVPVYIVWSVGEMIWNKYSSYPLVFHSSWLAHTNDVSSVNAKNIKFQPDTGMISQRCPVNFIGGNLSFCAAGKGFPMLWAALLTEMLTIIVVIIVISIVRIEQRWCLLFSPPGIRLNLPSPLGILDALYRYMKF